MPSPLKSPLMGTAPMVVVAVARVIVLANDARTAPHHVLYAPVARFTNMMSARWSPSKSPATGVNPAATDAVVGAVSPNDPRAAPHHTSVSLVPGLYQSRSV